MADNEKKPEIVSEGINIGNEEAITEIDIGNFLNDKNSDAVLYEGFHEDIKETERSLEDEINTLMDSIMSTGPVTLASRPKTTGKAEVPPMEDMWMSPEEYIDIPAPPVEKQKAPEAPAVDTAIAKDDIFSMLDSLKAETDSADSGYSKILENIEGNKGLEPVENYVPSAPVAPAVPVAPAAPTAPAAPVAPAIPTDIEIDIHSEDFDSQLAELLGDDETAEAPAEITEEVKEEVKEEIKEKPAYVDISSYVPPEETKIFPAIKVPQEESEPQEITFELLDEEEPSREDAPSVIVDSLTPNTGKTVGVVPDLIYEDDGKISRSERQAAKRAAKNPDADENASSKGDLVRKIVLVVAIITIIVSSGVLLYTYLINPMLTKNKYQKVSDMLPAPGGDKTDVVSENSDYPAQMKAKYTQLYEINPDIAGWITIDALDINFPVVQATQEEEAEDGKQNSFYLRKDFYKKKNEYGVPFFDSRIEDLRSLPRNTVIYGHNMHYDNLIFGLLENYREIAGYKSAPVIECNTIYGDYKWKVYAAFITNSTASQDNGYMFYYNFLDISDIKFEEYIREIDKRKFYDTGVDINPSDKILTLSTCCYDFDGARLVIVARMVREGENESVDTSKVTKNNNPKYPQAWYDANKKTNPYKGENSWTPN